MTNWLDIKELSIQEIMQVLPHRYPFLMIDRVLEVKTPQPVKMGMTEKAANELKKGTVVRAYKNITANEMQFLGHFPENPVFPGVLTLEAMAQAGAFSTLPFVALQNQGKIPPLKVALAGFDEVRFRKPVVPGDRLDITVKVKQTKAGVWSFEGLVQVDGKTAAEGNFMAMLHVGEVS